MQAIERHVESLDWITMIIMASLALLAIAKSVYPKRLEDFSSLLTPNKFTVFKGNENKPFHPFNVLLFVVNILSVALFIFILFNFFTEPFVSPVVFYIRIATAYASFVLLKFGIEKIVANVFEIDDALDYYHIRKLGHRNFISLFLLMFSLVFTYTIQPTAPLIYTALALILIGNLISLFVIYRENQKLIAGQWFYFILYLCALEIAPYIILYKLITN